MAERVLLLVAAVVVRVPPFVGGPPVHNGGQTSQADVFVVPIRLPPLHQVRMANKFQLKKEKPLKVVLPMAVRRCLRLLFHYVLGEKERRRRFKSLPDCYHASPADFSQTNSRVKPVLQVIPAILPKRLGVPGDRQGRL